ncbi:hypothetical protein O1611_g983 [Lasiodiplodia mahajangana]|uniref:Uncharacterized protein n=1 Tax=Lasiodiplodia mahajangana TaxID=1108764 RepID=A0ACC2JYM9_9PEZI|nr:hypothetical protein O1611_g983 [Lasiodiplodia mahajangana]
MGLTTFVPFLALVLGATAVPAQQDDTPALDCYGRKVVAHVTSWNTECGVGSGRPLGSEIAIPAWDKLCRPLPEDTHGLDVMTLADGCHVSDTSDKHSVDIERNVHVDENGMAGSVDFKIVKIQTPPQTGFAINNTEKAEWIRLDFPIADISDWVKEYLSGGEGRRVKE